ncbi:MAG: 50S ribosomal protein L29 [Actinomycetota bacterium]|nr:50S ribosomal protein L29 [Actinomycetota bacterium]
MDAAELRELSDAELVEKHAQFKQELFRLRFANVTGQLDNPRLLQRARRDVARVRTVQRQRELATQRGQTEERS